MWVQNVLRPAFFVEEGRHFGRVHGRSQLAGKLLQMSQGNLGGDFLPPALLFKVNHFCFPTERICYIHRNSARPGGARWLTSLWAVTGVTGSSFMVNSGGNGWSGALSATSGQARRAASQFLRVIPALKGHGFSRVVMTSRSSPLGAEGTLPSAAEADFIHSVLRHA